MTNYEKELQIICPKQHNMLVRPCPNDRFWLRLWPLAARAILSHVRKIGCGIGYGRDVTNIKPQTKLTLRGRFVAGSLIKMATVGMAASSA